MRYREITEAPLADYRTFGDWDNDHHEAKPQIDGEYGLTPKRREELVQNGNSFMSKIDRALIRKPETEAALRKAFARVPFSMYVYFLNDPAGIEMAIHHLDYGPAYPTGNANSKVHAILGQEVMTEVRRVLAQDKKGLVFILTHNEGGAVRHPLTPWMIAHRMSHASGSTISTGDYHSLLYDMASAYVPEGTDPDRYDIAAMARECCTFKAARDNNMLNDDMGEHIAEIMAQYLMTGRARFALPPRLRRSSDGGGDLTKDPEILAHAQKAVAKMEEMINDKIDDHLHSLRGKILVC